MQDEPEVGGPGSSEPLVLRPVGESERIFALDVLRGFAIFGIFLVNIVFFGRPLMTFTGPIGGEDASTGEVVAWAISEVFFEFKFISLFSLLFGVGMAVQLARATATGRSFAALFARRLAILGVFGLVHALGFWYGDILFLYACSGFGLLVLARCRPRTLLITAAAMFLSVFVLTGTIGAIQIALGDRSGGEPAVALDDPVEATVVGAGEVAEKVAAGTAEEGNDGREVEEVAAEDEPRSIAEGLREQPFGTVVEFVKESPQEVFLDGLSDLERVAFGDGPFLAAVAVRGFIWLMIVVQSVFTLFWRILATFLAGAAMMKLGFFGESGHRWQRRLLAVGVLVGLPLEIGAAVLAHGATFGQSWVWLAGEGLHFFGSLLLCLGYVGGVTILVRRGRRGWLARGLAAVGRMALSNYLLQTLVASFVMYWWGLGLFDTFSRPQMFLLVVVVFPLQIVGSVIWLRFFRAGPFEWLWRSLTYLRPQPLFRAAGR